MEILGLSTSPSSGGAYALVLNEDNGDRRLPIIIGTFEAQAIALELEHIRPPRPMTHDLIHNLVRKLNAVVKEVVVSDLREGTFYAKLVIQNEFETVEVDARPSDAIAVAIRFNAPIYVNEEIIREAGIQAEGADDSEEEVEPTKDFQEVVPSSLEEKKIDITDTLVNLKKKLDEAIGNEDYENAAKLRDEINRIKSNS